VGRAAPGGDPPLGNFGRHTCGAARSAGRIRQSRCGGRPRADRAGIRALAHAGRWVHAPRGTRRTARGTQRPQATAGCGAGLAVGRAAAEADDRGVAASRSTLLYERTKANMLNDKKLEVKSTSNADLSIAFEDFMRSFEAFKETNDQRLSEIERYVSADVVTVDKLARIDRALDENKRLVESFVHKG